MTDYKYLYIYIPIRPGSVFFSIFFSVLPHYYNCFIYNFSAKSPWIYPSNFSPTWLIFFFHSRSFPLTFSPVSTSVIFKYLSSSVIADLFAKKLSSYLFLARVCHVTLFFSNFLINFLLSFFHLWHLIYKCLTYYIRSLHYQQWGGSIFFILARYISTTP